MQVQVRYEKSVTNIVTLSLSNTAVKMYRISGKFDIVEF